MTNREIVSKIRSSLKWNSSDVLITSRAILNEARDTRNKYVYQRLNKRSGWNSANVFTPLLVQLQEVPLADFCEYQSDCNIARSIHRLPRLGEGIFGTASAGLYTLDKKRKFTEVDASRYQNILRLNLRTKDIYYWLFDGYLWCSEPTIESVILPAFVESEVPDYFSMDCEDRCKDCPENPFDQPFRCFAGMEKDITDAVVLFYKKIYSTAVEDATSDDLDENK